MTYETIVTKVKTAYEKVDLSNVKEHVAVQFNVTGEGGGAFYLEISEGKADVQPYQYYDHNILITAEADEIVKIAEGKIDAVKAYKEGKIAVEGDEEKLEYITVKRGVKKGQFVEAVAEKAGISKKDAAAVVDAYAEVIAEELSNGGKIQLVGFGTFETGTRAARTGRNPLTGETINIPASKTLKFKAGKALKDALN